MGRRAPAPGSKGAASRRRATPRAPALTPTPAVVLDDLADAICRWRPDTTLTFVNAAYCRLHERSEAELVGQRIRDVAGTFGEVDALVGRVLAALTPATPVYAHEHAFPGPDGVRYLQWTNRGLFDDDGTLREVQSVGRDITDYKRAVEHWQANEARYRLLAEHSPDAIARLAVDGTCLYVSPAARALTGFEPEAFVGRMPVDHWHPDDAERVKGVLASLADHPDGAVVAFRTRHRTRGWLWVESSIRPVRDAAGATIEYVVTTRDIQARTEAEEALRDSQQRLDLALAAADMGLWEWDLDRDVLLLDARWAAQLGYPPAEVATLTPAAFAAMLHPDDLPANRTALDAHLRGATPYYAHEHRLRTRDGAWKWVHARGRVVARTPDGRVRRIVGLQRDISGRKATEAARLESEARLRAVLASVPDFVSVADLDGRVTYLNRTQTGIGVERILGRRFWEFAEPEHRERLQALFARALASGSVQTVELEGRDGEGRPVWYDSRLVPIQHGGATSGVMVVTSEVTARRDREQSLRRFNAELEERVNARTAELQASLRELESFSYSVSHDLRAPLRAIDGFAQALAEDYAPQLDAQGLDHLERVRRAAQQMGRLIDDLLGLARVMRSDLHRTPVSLDAVAREVVAELQRGEPDRRVTVRIAGGLEVVGDPTLLRVALTNLLANAWKFTRTSAAAAITFDSELRGAERVFFVRDNGVGFDMTYAAKLFRPFQRLHEPTQFEGTGIGLATVQRIVARHGGWVWAESVIDAGATFYFTLPGTVE